MRLRAPLLVIVAVFASACIAGLETPNGRFGTIAVPAFDNGGGTYVMSPQAAFYGSTDLTYVPFSNDTCILAAYSASTSVSTGLVTLDAGDFLITQVSSRIDSLAPVAGIAFRVYEPLRPNGIPFIPGDTLSITVPGAVGGFPQSAISVRTAEPFTHDTIIVPAENADLPLVWTGATVPGSLMSFSLRYRNAVSSSEMNEQVFCSFADDGSATIPAAFLTGWRDALGDVRATRVVRSRWKEVVLDGRTRLSIVSSFGRPLLAYDP